ncbi:MULTISPECIES: hypothetical protein [unclassified Mesorhizobium]|uniref:hypothetical protein n=1 Tax=unclassified Mesorhizobium TaxID=325217 RepID=UPI001CCAAF00|nr:MULTISPECIES: hypothetical protein [unclassified Mesorhizobium]MBZ9732902.1 hypothetical protein [Mesorhizobium sp. CA9]MBZ9766251.1 hypothetical protein [Mesorhizobium sp. CA6]MBZ9824932.1 hypothetical protein [Mesorhizobium sp. CA18]MBZ9830552.1 hypothetical protein [Mesorhizobium sp. CA2]MBZ9836239.1 hypothetical protein [Mesorhizobium sp. CA3]
MADPSGSHLRPLPISTTLVASSTRLEMILIRQRGAELPLDQDKRRIVGNHRDSEAHLALKLDRRRFSRLSIDSSVSMPWSSA